MVDQHAELTRRLQAEVLKSGPDIFKPNGYVQDTAHTDMPAPADWTRDLIRSQKGVPLALLANAVLAIRNGLRGMLAFNEFDHNIEINGPSPWGSAGRWTDNDSTRMAVWLQQEHCIHVSTLTAAEASLTVARELSFHPVRQYLEGLKWDGTPRIDQWTALYLGTDNTPYTRAVGARFLISAAARIFRPGAKVDTCLILEGQQGLKKSTALRTLTEPWFTDEISDLGSKDAAIQTRGVWLIEIAELDSMSRTEVGRVKAFMSRSTDRFRPPYGRATIESHRQCVFAGSVNHSQYLRDETGGRRFWPVTCTGIRIEDLARDRDQLWAEAVARYRAGEVWWLDTAELTAAAEVEQSDRYEGDPWDELIVPWLNAPTQRWEDGQPISPWTSDKDSVTVADILTHCIGKAYGVWNQSDQNRVARTLRSLKWERRQAGARGCRMWRYYRHG